MLQTSSPVFCFSPPSFTHLSLETEKPGGLLLLGTMELPGLSFTDGCTQNTGRMVSPLPLYLSGRAIPGLVGTIMGLDGGLIIGGPGIIGICPPMGGLIPGATAKAI